MADDASGSGFKLGSGYVEVTADFTGFDQSVKDGAAKAQATASVKVTPDTTGFQEKLKALIAADGATADVKVKIDDTGSGGFSQLKNDAESAGGESGGLFSNSFVRGAFGGKATAITSAVTTGLAALPALAGVAGVAMGTAMIAELTVSVLEQNPKVKAAFTAMGTSVMATLQQAIAPLVPVVDAAAAQITGFVKSIEPQLKSLFTSLIPLIGPVLQSIEGLAAPVLGFFKAVVPAMAPFITGLLGLVKDVLPGFTTLVHAITPEMSVFAGLLEKLGTDVGSMLTDFSKAAGPSMTVLGALMGVIGGLLPIVGKLASTFADALAPVLVSVGKAVTALEPAIDTIGKAIGQFAGAVLKSLSEGLQAVGQLLTALAPSFQKLAVSLGQVFTVMQNQGVFNDLEDAFEQLVKPLTSVVSALVSGLAPILPEVVQFIGQLAIIIQGALVQAVTALAPPLTQLITVALKSLQQILPAVLPLLTEFAAILAGGLADVISGIATGLTAVMSAMDPTALGGIVVAIAAAAAGMKVWAAATAAMEGEGLLATIAGWVTGIGTFITATEGATIAEKALLAAEAVADALDPFAWVAIGAVAFAGLAAVIMNTNTGARNYVETLQEADNATGYNITGYDKLGEQLNATATNQQKLTTMVGQTTGAVYAAYTGTNLYAGAQQQLEAASNQAFTTAGKLNDAMNGLGTTYGITQQQAIKVAEAAGIQATAWTGGAAALDKANAKFAAYIINNQDALPGQQEINGLMAIFGNNAENAATQTNALNTAWQILVGNFVDKQEAILNASTAVQQYAVQAKQAGGNTQQLQQQFYNTINQLQPLIDQISKSHGPMATLYQDLQNQIAALQNSGPLNAQEQQALQRLQQLADALANSTHGLTTAQQQQASSLESSLIPQLTNLGVSSTTSQTDVKNLTDAIVNTGTQSAATQADRAQLISDLEKAGVSAQTAQGLVAQFVKEIGAIPISANTKIGVSATGQWSVTESSVNAPGAGGKLIVSSAAGGHIRGPGSETSDSIPALLSDNEFVVRAAAVHKYGTGLLDAINTMKFADGGLLINGLTGTPPQVGAYADTQENNTNNQVVNTTESAIATAINSAIASAKAAAAAAGPGGGSASANAALAQKLYPAWGSGAEWTAWNNVAMRESGWNNKALNASSGAYGIPQALPPSKMGAAANPPDSNPTAQINWMISYIKSAYGDPVGAWNHEQSAGWYDNGGYLMPGTTLARNDTGQPERVLSPGQDRQAARAAPVINNTFAYYGPQAPTPEMQQAMLTNLATAVGGAG